MPKRRVYISLEERQYEALRWLANREARCPGRQALKFVLDKLAAIEDLEDSLAGHLLAWEANRVRGDFPWPVE